MVPECVSRSTSSAWATVSTQVPMRLSACPDTYRRKFGTASAANIAEDAEGRPGRVIVCSDRLHGSQAAAWSRGVPSAALASWALAGPRST